MLNKSRLSEFLSDAAGTYVSILSQTLSLFWCSESGNPMNCSRPWVQEWELFNIKKDPYSGKSLIQSNQTRKYARVVGNQIVCDADRPLMECRFDYDPDYGTFKCYNGKYIIVDKNKNLVASGDVPQYFQVFEVIPVAISNEDSTLFAEPASDGKPVIRLNSKIPKTFYLLNSSDASYLETENFQFIIPTTTDVPITYEQKQIDTENFRFTIQNPTSVKKYYTIKSNKIRKFVGWDESGTNTCLYAKYDDDTTVTTHFQILNQR